MNAGVGFSNAWDKMRTKGRAAKGFEVVDDRTTVIESNWNIPEAEVIRVLGANATVPEGTPVVPYAVGTDLTAQVAGYYTQAGDLKIVASDTEKFYGFTLQEVRYFGEKNNRYDYPEAKGYGERIPVATGLYNAVIQNFERNTGITTVEPGDKLYVGSNAKLKVYSSAPNGASSIVAAQVIEEGYIPYDATTGSYESGALADELMIKCYCDQR